MQYISNQISRLSTFKRQRTESSCSSDERSISSETPQKRLKLDYAYNIITYPITTVFSITRRIVESSVRTQQVAAGPSTAETQEPVQMVPPKTQSTSVSVQTTPPQLTTSEQRLAMRSKHSIKKTTIQDVIQLEQREKYRQLLQKYTNSQSLYNTASETCPLSPDISKLASRYHFTTSTPASRHVTAMSPPSSDSGTGSGSEASDRTGPVHQNKRMIKEPTKKSFLPTWKNPFDDGWLKNWHKLLSENLNDNEKLIQETKKHLEEAKSLGKSRHEQLDKLVDKTLSGEISEDEAIGGDEELDNFPPLTDQMINEIDKALCGGNPNQTLVDAFNITLTRKDINTLKDLTWLNDEVINFYFNMLMDRSKKCPPTIHIFNTFFYPRLLKVGHQGLARWTRRVDLFAVDLIMIPIHLGMHWCLATIDIRSKTISYYDSLLGDNHQCLKALKDYIAAEHLSKKKEPLDIDNWNCVIQKDLPEQLNGCDCGVFTCKYAEYLSQDKPFDFDQSDMPYFRRRMIWEMINTTLL